MRTSLVNVAALVLGLSLVGPNLVGPNLAGGLHAQAPAPQAKRRTFDRVRAVVGDRVILESKIRRELAAQSAQVGRELNPQEKRRAEDEIIRALAREEVWVQIGKVIGREDPLAFERQIDSLVQEYMVEQQERFGSFARMNEELDALGTSWQSLRNEQRQRILRDSARSFAIGQRFRDGFSLVVTPAEIHAYYREHPADFAAQEGGDVAWISIPRSSPEARSRAEAAVAAWRAEDLGAADLARRFEGIALPAAARVQPADPEDPRPPLVKDFVRSGKTGDVLGPVERGESLVVLKLLDKRSQPALPFADARVQGAIRDRLVARHLQRLEGEILTWKAEQLLIWPANLLGR